jgi:hypothetical protein
MVGAPRLSRKRVPGSKTLTRVLIGDVSCKPCFRGAALTRESAFHTEHFGNVIYFVKVE